MPAISPPWRWVTWNWSTWMGSDVDYSAPHLVDPTRSTREKLVTCCGHTVGRTITDTKTFDPPPKGACKKCVQTWRKS